MFKEFKVNPFERINTQNVFFISDFHIGHKKVIKMDDRPFNDIYEMGEKIIESWNNVVDNDSIIYYLGDLYYKAKVSYVKWFVEQLKGDIRIILGNHDRISILSKMNRFSDIQSYKRLEIYDTDAKNEKQDIILFHYPMLSWDKQYYNSWTLHGHTHQNLTKTEYGRNTYYKRKVLDVSCNGHNYTPLSYSEIKNIMKKKDE